MKSPAFDSLLPYQRQSKDLERALPLLLAHLEAADDVTLKRASSALCPSRKIEAPAAPHRTRISSEFPSLSA